MDIDEKIPKEKLGKAARCKGKRVEPPKVNVESDSDAMNLQECDKRKAELNQTIKDLKVEFNAIKGQLFQEQMKQVETKIEELKAGTSSDYINSMHELEEQRRSKIEEAGILRQLQHEKIEREYDAEKCAALQNLENEIDLARDHFHDELIENMRFLEREKEKKPKPKPKSPKKPVVTSSPYIVYMLKDEDILEDLEAIKQAEEMIEVD